jgi:Mitochondrial-associated sphingomyelin phosphodiesterase
MYQIQTRLVDILNLPLLDRISQLRYCVETAPLKDLQAFFKTLVHHIFGLNSNNIGWGLRAITTTSPEYYYLYSFFNPHEAFFRLLYRLQSGYVKFDVNFQELPKYAKIQQIFHKIC